MFFNSKRFILLVIGFVFAITFSPTLNQAQEVESPIALQQAYPNSAQIAQWEQLLASSPSDAAALHNNLAVAYRQKGQLPQAIAHWQELIQLYKDKDDRLSRTSLVTAWVDQAQAYIALGQTRQAIPQLRKAIEHSEKLQLLKAKAVATKAIGNAYFTNGNLEQAIATYSESLRLATRLEDSSLTVAVLNNLSNTRTQREEQYRLKAQYANAEGETEAEGKWLASAQREREASLAVAKRAVQESQGATSLSAVRARLHLMRLKPDLDYKSEVVAMLRQLPASRSKVFLTIELAQLEAKTAAIALLEEAAKQASVLKDFRSESYALGELAQIYQKNRQYEPALKLAQQAQRQAQKDMAFESLYQWQWLAGKLYQEVGDLKASKQAYRGAVSTLQDIRSNMMAVPESLQFKYRDRVEPVYREFLALLLESGDNRQIAEAIDVFQLLQLKELQNFFGDDCIEVERMPEPSEVLAKTNLAVVRTIILDDRTYVVLQLPNGALKSYLVDVPAQKLSSDLLRWRFQLENLRLHGGYKALSQQLYDLLVRPMEQDLAAANPETLVFINDGLLRNVPMAALHDGDQFLVEKYPLAVSLGFHLNVKSQPSQSLHPLIFGITEAVEGWPPLPNVGTEAENIEQALGGDKYLNEEFTLARLKEAVQEDYSIVHLATHGQFVGTADDSYLQAYNERIPLEDFEQVLTRSDRPINLLTLSACQTAAGNERSVLGIAGVAARAGVEKTLGSLWYLNDIENVTLVADFYQYLKQPGVSEAQALRKAQLQQIASPYSHPSIWASIVLIGDRF